MLPWGRQLFIDVELLINSDHVLINSNDLLFVGLAGVFAGVDQPFVDV